MSNNNTQIAWESFKENIGIEEFYQTENPKYDLKIVKVWHDWCDMLERSGCKIRPNSAWDLPEGKKYGAIDRNQFWKFLEDQLGDEFQDWLDREFEKLPEPEGESDTLDEASGLR